MFISVVIGPDAAAAEDASGNLEYEEFSDDEDLDELLNKAATDTEDDAKRTSHPSLTPHTARPVTRGPSGEPHRFIPNACLINSCVYY